MTAIVLFGIGSPVAADVEESIWRSGATIAAGINNRPVPSQLADDIPVLNVDELSAELLPLPFLVPLFSSANRRTAVEEAERCGLRNPFTLIDPTALLPRRFDVAAGSYINAGCVIGSRASIGRYGFLNRGTVIGHHATFGDFVSIGPGAVICGNVTIGSGASIGGGATILPSIVIGENAVVGAGAVVTRNVDAGSKVVGNPARPMASS